MYCRRCGAPLHQGLVICPECGSRQRKRFSAVRCAECGGRVALGLSVCPHCGRNVRPAGPRFGLWLGAFVVLALAGLWGAGRLPVEKVVGEIMSARDRLANVVQVLGPAASSIANGSTEETTEVAQAESPGEGEEVVVSGAGPLPADVEQTPEAALGTTAVEPTAARTATLPVTATAVVVATTSMTGTATLESTSAAGTAPATASPTPTSTVAPTATFTPAPTETPTATASPTLAPPTPTATPARTGVLTYKVKSGDTLSTIAIQFGITWQQLAEANKLTSRSVLRIGQELIVPGQPGSSVASGATATATRPVAVAPTAVPVQPTPAPYLPAPVLQSPGDQTPYHGSGSFELVWNAVPGMPPDGQYQVTVLWNDQAGQPQQYWWYTRATSSGIPAWLYGQAAQPARKYSWYVTAVQVTTDGKGGEKAIPLSPPSDVRVFYWS